MALLSSSVQALVSDTMKADLWFAMLKPERQTQLLSYAAARSMAAGARLYRLGDPPNGLHALVKGEVRLISYPQPGMETLSSLIRPGQWFGELSTIDGQGRPHEAMISEPSTLLTIKAADMRLLLDMDPLWWRDLALLAAMHQRHGMREFVRMRGKTSVQRMAGFLANRAAADKRPYVALSQSELAQLIGLSRQRINIILGRMQAEGLVLAHYRKIEILNMDQLQRLARG
jgi:CRP/FNR family transcriptional regulator, cyclic AMP receptor protein